MTSADLLRGLETQGATFRVDGDRLRVNAPPGVLTPEVVAALGERKPELLAILRDGTATTWPEGIRQPAVKAGCGCVLCAPDAHGYANQLEAAKVVFPEAFQRAKRG